MKMSESDASSPKGTTELTPPVEEVHASLKTAASYSERVRTQKVKTDSVKGKGKPLGGAPPIPDGKLSELAQPVFDVEEEKEDDHAYRVPQEPPPEVPGVGAAYAANQAMMRGETNGPISMKQAKQFKKPLSKESVEALEATKKEIEASSSGEESDDTKERLEKADVDLIHREDIGIDFGQLANARSGLMSKGRREAVESRLGDLDIADMIMKREIVQRIPVIPGKLEYTIRTYNQSEHLFCLNYVYSTPGSQAHAEELLNTCKMVCALVAINGAELPTHIKDRGSRDEKVDQGMFERKLHHVASFPTQIIADISVQCIWFDQRVSKLFSLDNLKNG